MIFGTRWLGQDEAPNNFLGWCRGQDRSDHTLNRGVPPATRVNSGKNVGGSSAGVCEL